MSASNSATLPTPEPQPQPQQQQPKSAINAAKLSVDETPEQVRARMMQEALDRANAVPEGGFRNASDPPPQSPVYRPPPQPQVDPKLQQAWQIGYQQSQTEHYVQGFVGALTLVGLSYLGYRGFCWAFSGKCSAPKALPATTN